MKNNNILVIKHGALGDIILAGAAIKAIREFHKDSTIYCLTTKPYYKLMQESPWFDKVILDVKPQWSDIFGWLNLMKNLKKNKFYRVYDLQTSDRSSLYFYLFFLISTTQWSGIAYGSLFRHKNFLRKKMHTLDRHKDQLDITGLKSLRSPDWKWLLKKEHNKYAIQHKYVLIVTGSSAHRENKIWPKESFGSLVGILAENEITSVFIGLENDKKNIDDIINMDAKLEMKKSINLAGKTSYKDLAFLANSSLFVIGNDTGPIHLAAACGARVFVLFGSGSDPKLCAPRGKNVVIIRKNNIKNILVRDVLERVEKFF